MAELNIWDILRKRYPEKEYALMKEVSDAAGFGRSRSADYVAVNLWPSRGLAIEGIELKSYRGDWLGELKKPEKAENIFQYCDYWWLLTTDESIAKIEEIPDTWGWLVIKNGKIITKKDAPKLNPIGISKNFMATMLKRAADKTSFVHIDSIKDKIEEARNYEKEISGRKEERLQKELAELRKTVSEFEQASGIRITYLGWSNDPTKIGKAVKFIQDGGADNIKSQLLKLKETAKNISDKLEEGLKVL